MEWVTLHQKCYERFEERMQAMHRYLTTRPVDFEGLAIKHYVFREAIDRGDFTACIILRRGLENWSPFLEHYLAMIDLQETNYVIEFSRDPDFPNLKPIWSEHETTNDDK